MTYILTIAQEGGISKAAAKLFITQSALDQQLLKLEKELDTQLFFRSRTGFALTPAGKIYVDYAKQMLLLKNEAYRRIQDLADQQRGTLSLAFAPERGMEMFMEVYPLFYQSYPKMNVVPREIGVRRQLEMLQDGELDLGFVALADLDVPGLTSTTLLEEEFVLITPKNHPMARLAAPSGEPLTVLEYEQLRELTFCLIYRQSTQREIIDPMFQQAGIRPNIFLETASNRANVSMVKNGLSCSIMPYHYARQEPDVACFRLAGRPTWKVGVCSRRSYYLSKAAQHFIRLAEDYFRRDKSDLIEPEERKDSHVCYL